MGDLLKIDGPSFSGYSRLFYSHSILIHGIQALAPFCMQMTMVTFAVYFAQTSRTKMHLKRRTREVFEKTAPVKRASAIFLNDSAPQP
jgi:hypothetical protein